LGVGIGGAFLGFVVLAVVIGIAIWKAKRRSTPTETVVDVESYGVDTNYPQSPPPLMDLGEKQQKTVLKTSDEFVTEAFSYTAVPPSSPVYQPVRKAPMDLEHELV
jgi:hypothetical protein